MKLSIDRAVRLVREDLDRLAEVPRRQVVAALAPRADLDRVAADVEREGSDDDSYGLVFVRVVDEADPARAWDGWFLDLERWPSPRTAFDGGALFVAGTTDPAGASMSQGTWDAGADPALVAALRALGPIAVAVKGPARRADPPFAPAKPAQKAKGGTPMDLAVESAVRHTEASVRAAPVEARFQLLHGVRPRFATPTPEGMEAFTALGVVYSAIDPGPGPAYGHRRGLVHARFRDRGSGEAFEGWFFDAGLDAPAYWPSRTANLSEGRLFRAGTVEYVGVAMDPRRGAVIDKKRPHPVAEALASGLKALGPVVEVTLADPAAPDATGYFGTAAHRQQVEEARAAGA